MEQSGQKYKDFNINQLAPKKIRLANFLIDTILLLSFYYFIFSTIMFPRGIFYSGDDTYLNFDFILLYLLYYSIFEFFFRKTIGKMITGTTILLDNGMTPSFLTILKRSAIRLIPFEPISCLITEKAYGWHDKWSNTIVIYDTEYEKIMYNE